MIRKVFLSYSGAVFTAVLFLGYGVALSLLSWLITLPNQAEAARAYQSTGLYANLLCAGIVSGFALSIAGFVNSAQLVLVAFKMRKRGLALKYINNALYLISMGFAPIFLIEHNEMIRQMFSSLAWSFFMGCYLLVGMACFLTTLHRTQLLTEYCKPCVTGVCSN